MWFMSAYGFSDARRDSGERHDHVIIALVWGQPTELTDARRVNVFLI